MAIDPLLILSVAAPAVAAASAIWGLTRELSSKTEEGERQLTKEGRVAIALAVTGALIGTLAVGFRTLREQQSAADTKRLEAQRIEAADRAILDAKNWRDFNTKQQKALADLGIAETRRNAILAMLQTQKSAGKVISNADLLAAIEKQRDVSFTERTNRNIDETAPLTSLAVRISVSGFSAADFARLVEAEDAESRWAEDGNYEDGAGQLLQHWRQAWRIRTILQPAFAMIIGGGRDAAELGERDKYDDVALVLDFDVSDSWVLPIGFTNQPKPVGFVFNRTWLAIQAPYGDLEPDSPIEQKIGNCELPDVSLDRAHRSVVIAMNLRTACLNTVVHRIPGTALGVRTRLQPTAALAVSATDQQLFDFGNLYAGNALLLDCLQGPYSNSVGRYRIAINYLANRSKQLTKQFVLNSGKGHSLDFSYSIYNEPLSYGSCVPFG